MRIVHLARATAVVTLVTAVVVALAPAPATSGTRHAPVPSSPVIGTITTPQGIQLRLERVAQNLDTPWDLKWAPDGRMWFTERGGRVSRLDVETGEVTPIGTVPEVVEEGEAGLMGFAFHPDFPMEPWVYFAHSYSAGGSGRDMRIRNRLVRMRYADGSLSGAVTLLDDIPGGRIHNGAALAIGPDRLLYMSTGDAGNGSLAQDTTSLAGKVLRLTLDGLPAPGNPFASAIWSWGHRNPQGLAFHSTTGALYAAEQGGRAEDEVNRIEGRRNYGWPTAEGMCDLPAEAEFCRTAVAVQPLWVVSPPVGLSGIDLYESEAIPGWKGSLLATSLAGTSLYRLTLSSDKRTVTASERLHEGDFGRLRDVLTGRDGAVYLATSNRDGLGRPRDVDDRIIRIRR